MKTMHFIIFVCILCINVSSVFGFSTHDTSITRSFDKEEAVVGESIIATVTFTHFESTDIRGFFYSEYVQEGLNIETVSVTVVGGDNEGEIDNYSLEIVSDNDAFPESRIYRWILELPPDFNKNNPIVSGETLKIVYSITSPNDGIFDFEEFHWVGYFQDAPVDERASFGHNKDTEEQVLVFKEIAADETRDDLVSDEILKKNAANDSSSDGCFIDSILR